MSRSSRLNNILNQRENLWANDSETDTSLLSDNEEKNISFNHYETSSDENNSQSSCCLICSILPNLSNINTCRKHLNLLNTSKTPTQVVYMMHPAINNCHCKHRCRSISSSSSESEFRHQRKKKRSMIVQSSDSSSQSDLFFSPTIQSQANRANARLSPSLPPSSTINTNKHYPELLLTPFLQRNSIEILKTSSPDVIEINSELSSPPPPPPPTPIVHVKDENESLSDNDQKKTMINMSEATKQMFNHQYPKPVILLKRICLEK